RMREPDRRDGQHAEPVAIDEERILVGPVARAAVLDDAEPARRDLFDDGMVEEDDAVRDVLLEALARELSVAALRGDDGGDALVLQPAEEPPQLAPQDGGVREAGEERFDRIEGDPLGSDRVDGVAEPDEEPFEVVLAGLLD